MELEPIKVAVVRSDDADAPDPEAFARVSAELIDLPLTGDDPEQVIVLARSASRSCQALVIDLPDHGETTRELLSALAEETERGLVQAGQAVRISNAATVLTALDSLEGERPVIGLVGELAHGLVDVLEALGLDPEQIRELHPPEPAPGAAITIVRPGEEPADPTGASNDAGAEVRDDQAEAGDDTQAGDEARDDDAKPAGAPPRERPKTRVNLSASEAALAALDKAQARQASEQVSPAAESTDDDDAAAADEPEGWPEDVDLLLLSPGVLEPPPDACGDAVRVRLHEADEGLTLPFLVRAAADTRAIPAPAALASMARALADLAEDGFLPAVEDPRLLLSLTPAAAATIDAERCGDLEYVAALARLRSPLRRAVRRAQETVRHAKRKVVFVDGEDARVLRAARDLQDHALLVPILLGDQFRVEARAKAEGVSLKGIRVYDPRRNKRRAPYGALLRETLGTRRGMSAGAAAEQVGEPVLFAACMLLAGDAHAIVACGREEGLAPLGAAADLLPRRAGLRGVCGVHLVAGDGWAVAVGDTAVDSDPTSEQLCVAVRETARLAGALFESEPRAALLSFTNYGAEVDASVTRVHRARELARVKDPRLKVDGPLRPELALDGALQKDQFPFCALDGEPANALVVAERAGGLALAGGLAHFAKGEAVGPLVGGLVHPVAIAGPGANTDQVFMLAACSAVLAAELPEGRSSGSTPRPPAEPAEAEPQPVSEMPPAQPLRPVSGSYPRPTTRRHKLQDPQA